MSDFYKVAYNNNYTKICHRINISLGEVVEDDPPPSSVVFPILSFNVAFQVECQLKLVNNDDIIIVIFTLYNLPSNMSIISSAVTLQLLQLLRLIGNLAFQSVQYNNSI